MHPEMTGLENEGQYPQPPLAQRVVLFKPEKGSCSPL